MNVQAENVRDLAVKTYEDIHAKAHGEKMKARLKAVNDACSFIVDHGGIPQERNVREWIVTNRPAAHLGESTIYNKRGGKISPYLRIIQAWAAVAASKPPGKSPVAKKGSTAGNSNEFITEDDICRIDDIVVRHKVALLKGQYEGLRKQSEMRKAIKDNPPAPGYLTVGKEKDAIGYDMALGGEEVEALADFLRKSSTNRYGIEFDEVGSVVVKRSLPGARISKPGFVDAIRKIASSYGAEVPD